MANVELDYFEYSSDNSAQAAYVTDGTSDVPSSAYATGSNNLVSHFDGADGATAYTDPVAGAYTFVGNAQLDTAQYKFATASLLLDGTGDYVTSPDSASWAFGSGDFTIDFWVRFNTLVNEDDYFLVAQYGGAGSRSWNIEVYQGVATATVYFNYSTDGTAVTSLYVQGVVLTTATWYHFAVTRNGANLRIFVDGVQQGATKNISTDSIYDSGSVLSIGAGAAGAAPTDGWFDEVRILKGTAVWTSNFNKNLQSYSESTIKTQGSYSLKAIASTSSLNKTLTRTISSPINQTVITYDELTPLGHKGALERHPSAQGFSFTSPKTIYSASIYLGTTVGSPSGNVTCRIETDNVGNPSGTLVDANATKTQSVTGSSWNEFIFPATFVVNGTNHIVFNCDDQTSGNYWVLSGADNVYSGGIVREYYSGAWHDLADYDFSFKLTTLPIDLSSQTKWKFDMRASRTGSNVKIGIHDSGGTTTETTPNITSADTFQTVEVDISGVADADKNAIDRIILTQVNADSATTYYVDNMFASAVENADFTATALALTLALGTTTYGIGVNVPVSVQTLALSLKDVIVGHSIVVTGGSLTLALYVPSVRIDGGATATALELTLALGGGSGGSPLLDTRIIRKSYWFGATEQVTHTKLNNFVDTAIWEISNQAVGDLFYYNGTKWVRLAKGSNGQVLTMGETLPGWA